MYGSSSESEDTLVDELLDELLESLTELALLEELELLRGDLSFALSILAPFVK